MSENLTKEEEELYRRLLSYKGDDPRLVVAALSIQVLSGFAPNPALVAKAHQSKVLEIVNRDLEPFGKKIEVPHA